MTPERIVQNFFFNMYCCLENILLKRFYFPKNFMNIWAYKIYICFLFEKL